QGGRPDRERTPHPRRGEQQQRAVLRVLPMPPRREPPQGGPKPLDHREQPPLGARCRLRRGSCPQPQGQWPREPRSVAKAGPQHPRFPPRQGPAPAEDQEGWLEPRPPPRAFRQYAMALPLRGRAGGGGAAAPSLGPPPTSLGPPPTLALPRKGGGN